MHRRRTVFISGSLACVAIGLLLVSARLREPSYHGRSLSDWLEVLEQREDVEGAAEARVALRQMGTNALPHLLSMLRTKDSRFKRLLQPWEGKHPFVDFRLNAANMIRYRAVDGIMTIGPQAAPLIPALTDLLDEPDLGSDAAWALSGIGREALPPLIASLNHSNSAVRRTAAYALGRLAGEEPGRIGRALIQVTNDADVGVRRMVYRSLGYMTNDQAFALAAILSGLRDPDMQVQRACMLNAGNFGTNATEAVPLLVEAMNDRRGYVLAARSLRAVDPRAALAVHSANLQGTNNWKRVQAAVSLGEFGRDATDAVPLLLKELSDPDEDVKGSCAIALLKIDFKSATNAGVDPSRYRGPWNPPSRQGRRGSQ